MAKYEKPVCVPSSTNVLGCKASTSQKANGACSSHADTGTYSGFQNDAGDTKSSMDTWLVTTSPPFSRRLSRPRAESKSDQARAPGPTSPRTCLPGNGALLGTFARSWHHFFYYQVNSCQPIAKRPAC